MKFDVESGTKKKQDPLKEKILIYAAIFFVVLTIVLIIIYFATSSGTTTPQNVKGPTLIKSGENNLENEEEPSTKLVDETSNTRPIAVMIDNNTGNESHVNLQHAYMNYEILVEGGLTRIMSIYKDSNLKAIGPIRSARDYFIDYALEHDAIYVHYGWSPQAQTEINNLKVNNINGMVDTKPFWRDTSTQSPHNVFLTVEKLNSLISEKGYQTTSDNWKTISYEEDKVDLISKDSANAKNANDVSLVYSSNENRTYKYDSVNEYYLRSMNGTAHKDRVTKTQYNVKNIIIIKVSSKVIDNEGRLELATVGEGDGFYITNGNYVPIKWKKESKTAKTKYTYLNGSEITLNNGNTMIQVIPPENEIKIN